MFDGFLIANFFKIISRHNSSYKIFSLSTCRLMLQNSSAP